MYFESSLQHLLAEMERLDLLIAGQIARARQLFSQDEQFRGLYISEEDVQALLAQPIGRPRWTTEAAPLSDPDPSLEEIAKTIARREEESLRQGVDLRLHRVQQLFGLSGFEIDCLLVCFAVELDLRYERLYAYLQDDVTKKHPSVDLVLNLLSPTAEAKFQARRHFSAGAPLLRHRLLQLLEEPSQPHSPFLARYLRVDSHIAQYLIGGNDIDQRIQPYAVLRNPQSEFDALLVNQEVAERIGRFMGCGWQREIGEERGTGSCGASPLGGGGGQAPAEPVPCVRQVFGEPQGQPLIYLQGGHGVGKRSTVEAVCRERGIPLLVVSLQRLSSAPEAGIETTLHLIQREARLREAAVYWSDFDVLLQEQSAALLRALAGTLAERSTLTFAAGERPWEPVGAWQGISFACIELPRTAFADRSQVWKAALAGHLASDAEGDVAAVASKFRFSGGEIRAAAATAVTIARLREGESSRVTVSDLYEACRLHSNHNLSTLAKKISPKYRWQDIVLPVDRLDHLREICNHVRYRDRVYGEWGFDGKLSLGKGLSVLFAGPSGTGKTMAAEIIACELGLDLFKIDLSTVVSKYIGETEKNLSRIFSEAETSNAILFFDEADALFGKRSEVKDSHDRYANIEIGYLLQRMEEYEGVVILATNFRKNMDEAFVRRLQFTVEFPFPDAKNRRRIWEGVWPRHTPLHPELDLNLIARRFEMSGGNIRNIALAAAFFAAGSSGVVEMGHVLQATKRELQKLGKVIDQSEFEAAR